MSKAGVVLHLPAHWLEDDSDAMLPFYRNLIAGLAAQGVPVDCVTMNASTALARVEQDANFHILNHGRLIHPRALMAGIAYVYPFWNLDPQGIRAFSSIAQKKFRPADIDGDIARAFLTRLRQKWVEPRQSRYEQPIAPAFDLPNGAVAVFLQSESHRALGETCYLDGWSMLQTVLNSVDASVIVKPHPFDTSQDTRDKLRALQKAYPYLHVSTGNIHDILKACTRVVTINSAVGIEAYMHRKPVILCGQSDFHHIADVATSQEALTAILSDAPRGRVYAKYLYWYFAKNCINAGHHSMADQVLARIAETGFDMSKGH